MNLTSQQHEIIQRCRRSAIWFMQNFVRIKHPGAGIIPFNPFDYQRMAIKAFRQNRFNLFRKCRQCFSGDSMVWGPFGSKRIADIKIGDLVYSFSPVTKRIVAVPVQEVFINGERECVRVESNTGHVSTATLDHKYFTWGGTKEAAYLTSNDSLLEIRQDDLSFRTGEIRLVQQVGLRLVYDLRVPPYDNYVVDGAVVHNSGISKVAGIFALWFGMFAANKTILIVSRTDEDAKTFLSENIKLPFRNLPQWMQKLWLPRGTKDNEHSLEFSNGTRIRSLTSHPDVLRSNASSLNIIDEAAFIQDMDAMYAGGRPTLTHGGSMICISTANGVGNWYWNAWTDAEAGLNEFHPIFIRWWDMTWAIEFIDPLSGNKINITPTAGIQPTAKGKVVHHPELGRVELIPERYGPWWSPWLEREWRSLQAKGEGWKFEQEILADFIGSGNTIVPKEVLTFIDTTTRDDFQRVTGPQTYVHPTTGVEEIVDFTPNMPEEGLWIWKEPVLARPDRFVGARLIEAGAPAHSYAMGVDVATGKGHDYSAVEVFDIDTREQVAELMFHCLPSIFIKMVDRLGRWYNCALAVIERNNGGDDMIDDLQRDYAYPRLWRRIGVNDKPSKTGGKLTYAHYGHFTSQASKPVLNKYLLDFIRDSAEAGFTIYSRRLLKQLQIYVRKKDRAGRDTGKTEAETGPGNYDDLVMACAMGLLGVQDAAMPGGVGALPLQANQVPWTVDHPNRLVQLEQKFVDIGNRDLIPITCAGDNSLDQAAIAELARFSAQLITKPPNVPIVSKRKFQF